MTGRPTLTVLPGGKDHRAPAGERTSHPSSSPSARFAVLTLQQLTETAQAFTRNADGSWTVTFAPQAELALRTLVVAQRPDGRPS